MAIKVAILTISDGAAAGTREDRSGPALEAKVLELGWKVVFKKIVPDNAPQIAHEITALTDADTDLVLTTGGTGLGPRDVTPEAVRSLAHREIPGFGELMRAEGRKSTKFADLSRGGAASRGATLIISLPG